MRRMFPKSFLAVVVVVAALSMLAPAQQPDPLPALAARVDSLQVRLENIEAVRAIKRLQYAYGHYVEFGLWNDFADLFSDDAITNYQQGARGREQVRKLFLEQVGQGRLGLADGRIYPHILFQPVVNLAPDGRSAKGRWRILAMLGGLGGSATWYSGVYENEYVFDKGAWKIGVLRSEPRATAAYTAAGWKDSGITVPPHYDDAGAAKAVPEPTRGATADRPSVSLDSVGVRVSAFSQRAARLNDQTEVTNLQDTYGYAVDRRLWDQAAGLFASDGTLEPGLQGVYVGRASIRRGFDQFGTQTLRDGERNDHVYLQTLVTVAADGQTARARGVEMIFSAAPEGRNGELSEGVFENTFVNQGGVWKIQSVHFYPRMIVDAAAGWAKSSKPAPGPSKEFPPDRSPTSAYEIYPKFSVAPFHFDNPVTGRPPQYPEGVLSRASTTQTPVSSNGPAARNAAELEARVAALERSIAAAELADIAENLIDAHGYGADGSLSAEGGVIFASQVLQPVIEIASDRRSAKVRARLLNPTGISGGTGYWSSGTLEGEVVSQEGGWKFQSVRTSTTWTASYPGGWARTP